MSVVFQNPNAAREDRDVYRDELRLARQAEPLGFDSVWGVEHHFTDYTMCPDVLQFLTYMAGCTEHIQLGSMVVVLPWHDPIRVAEQVSVLDHVSDGRFIFGFGRGLGRVEFEGFRVPMGDSRGLFNESAAMILAGLENGFCEYEGEFVQQPRRDIRPRPFKTFRGRTYAAGTSAESMPIIARLGVGILIIPQKPWDAVAEELSQYREVYRETNGEEAPPPACAGWVFCEEDAGRAEELARKYIGGYYASVVKHYEFLGDHLGKTSGYESYRGLQEMATSDGGLDKMVDFFLDLQIWGTPEDCYAKSADVLKRVGANRFIPVFSYAGMPYEEAERNMKLFASEVMPEVKRLSV
jgi:alkanesulfonate monooxygenase SsuD/methylene tetrahydromethanopterin reductase-like flavin-dependent oxidoreductase (luciferase family)